MPIDKEFYIDLHGKPYVLFPGLLKAATAAGLENVETVIEQIPSKENGQMAVVKATALFRDPENPDKIRTFTCVGDASQETTRLKAYLRMAETRAIARCFRLALDVGETALEELGDLDEGREERGYPREQAADRSRRGAPGNGAKGEPTCARAGCGKTLTQGQAAYSLKTYNALLCPECQKTASQAGSG